MRVAWLTLGAVALCLVACDESGTGEGAAVDSGKDALPPNEDGGLPLEDGGPSTDGALDVADEALTAPDAAPPDSGPPGSGCGLPPGANDRAWTLMHQGIERVFHVHFPSGYDPAMPTPVVLNFHGRQSNAQQQMIVSKMISASLEMWGFFASHALP